MERPKRPRVFADANVLIRGVTFPRYPYEILRLAARHKIVLVLSHLVLDDARRYLTELFPEHLPKLDGFLATALVEVVPDPEPDQVAAYRDLVRDVKDVPVVLAAAQAPGGFSSLHRRRFDRREREHRWTAPAHCSRQGDERRTASSRIGLMLFHEITCITDTVTYR